MKAWIAAAALTALPHVALANVVIPPEDKIMTEAAWERAAQGQYDQADPFCSGKALRADCLVPGNPFEGGGRGRCEAGVSILHDKDGKKGLVTARCVVRTRYPLDSGIAPAQYRWTLPSALCQADPAATLKGVDCRGGVEADRFCRGKAPGEPCVVDLVAEGEGKPDSFPGTCAVEAIGSTLAVDGRLVAISADLLLCRTPNLDRARQGLGR